MRLIHYLNAALWFANALLWTFHATTVPGSFSVAFVSLCGTVASIVLGRNTDDYRYR